MKKILLLFTFVACGIAGRAAYILLPMDESQTNHLRAYGIAWNVLDHKTDVQWLLNYKGGSYLFEYSKEDEQACLEKGVLFQTLPDAQAKSILRDVKKGQNNTAVVEMQRAPKIGVFAPNHPEKWDDAVMNVLNYAGIPFEVIYDKEVLQGDLSKYDWLHLHHDDFTGQYNRFYAGFNQAQWYMDDVAENKARAKELGFAKVSQMKLAVAQKMKLFVSNGGFLFAMCTATDSYDIALSADGVDINTYAFDGDQMDPEANSKLNFENCLAFQNFKVKTNPYEFEFSDIDTYGSRIQRGATEANDYFTLTSFDARAQATQVMLTQNHKTNIKGFWGATTGYNKQFIKPGVDILGEYTAINEARYIHGTLGEGMWTFYGGHDPEDYQHRIEEPAPDMNLHSNSPGYRLILNNVLFQSTRTTEETHVQFSAYPSPATTQFTVNYTLEEETTGILNIYDATGKIAYTEVLPAGSTTTTVDVNGLPNGSYLWRIESNNKAVHTDRFSVSH